MEWLSHRIHSAIKSGKWMPLRLSQLGPSLSYLIFADDLIIFGHAVMQQAKIIKEILENFYGYYGHQINMRKMIITKLTKNTTKASAPIDK